MYTGCREGFVGSPSELPAEIETHRQKIRLRRTECCVGTGKGMDPIKHDSCAIAPVPIEASCEVVVLARPDIVEIEIRPA